MSTATYALRDSAIMMRRDIRHSLRYPIMAISGLMVPVFLLLLFVGALFGGATLTELRDSFAHAESQTQLPSAWRARYSMRCSGTGSPKKVSATC